MIPFVTADQLVAHLIGDYVLQSHWMATEKTKRSLAAAVHAFCYTLPFLILTQAPEALAVIAGTHFVIDRWRLARYVVWLKNVVLSPLLLPSVLKSEASRRWSWAHCSTTGYPDDVPPWLAVWLLIVADNTLHILCNAAALRWCS